METLHQWAEQILFGSALTEKLAPPPSGLPDDAPGPALAHLSPPGRPAVLPLSDGRPRAAFPGPGTLGDPRARGQVLHFFANHELLALELMALVLLRFPDAPRAFRRGLASTMAEEQRHLSLYLGRMATLGVELGEIPVNDFFWRSLAPCASPLEFVAGMSLTFEQANLDFALAYQDAFAAVGDAETAALMAEVYADEVGHVRHGLRWLRRWKDPAQDEWAAHRALLAEPLTLARAKGRPFSRAARQAAGLPEDYIDRLEVYTHSRGRPPRVFYFNPGVEEELTRPPEADLPAVARDLQRDLEWLPALLAAQDDAVLVQRAPSTVHLQRLRDAGLVLPEIIAYAGDLTRHPARHRTLGDLEPWGWGPATARFLAPLGAPAWDPARARLAGKAFGVQVLRRLSERLREDWLAPDWTAGQVCTSAEAVQAHLDHLRAEGLADVVLKAEYGAAGRGAVRLLGGAPLGTAEARWLARTLAQQGCVVVEPWLDRRLDLSLHFDGRGDGRLRFAGLTRFFTDARGQYAGHWLGRLSDDLPPEVIALLYGEGRDPRRLGRLSDAVGAVLSACLGAGWRGPVGVDVLVYACPRDGRLRLKPVVEVNPRWSMGRLALALQKHVPAGVPAVFRLLPWGPALAQQAALAPLSGRPWQEGVLLLTEPTPETRVVAAVLVGRHARQEERHVG